MNLRPHPLIRRQEVRYTYLKCLTNKGSKGIRKEVMGPSCIITTLNTYGSEKQIINWLDALPIKFRASEGAGAYWYDAFSQEEGGFVDRNGICWTYRFGEYNELLTLGIALGRIRFTLMPTEWRSCPEGMPHLVYLDRVRRRRD